MDGYFICIINPMAQTRLVRCSILCHNNNALTRNSRLYDKTIICKYYVQLQNVYASVYTRAALSTIGLYDITIINIILIILYNMSIVCMSVGVQTWVILINSSQLVTFAT